MYRIAIVDDDYGGEKHEGSDRTEFQRGKFFELRVFSTFSQLHKVSCRRNCSRFIFWILNFRTEWTGACKRDQKNTGEGHT